jgi:hypothetical protein
MTRAVNLASAGSIVSESVGDAPGYMARAWVNFNGTGTVAIRAAGNVSSITDNGTGDYTVNFSTAFADANYCVVTGGTRSDGLQSTILGLITTTAPSTTVARVFNKDDGGTANDALYACISFFR